MTVRGRIGAAFDRVMVYVTGGAGGAQFTGTATAAGFGSASTSRNHGVWTVGAGVEVGILENLSARIEYLYLDTGDWNMATSAPFTVTNRTQDNLVRAGLNLRLPIN